MSDRDQIVQQEVGPDGHYPLPVEVDPARLTPVFGTAEPASGLSAELRRRAYSFPDYATARWMLLLAADRLDAREELMRETVTPGEQGQVLRHFARLLRAHPAGAVAMGAAALAGIAVVVSRRS